MRSSDVQALASRLRACVSLSEVRRVHHEVAAMGYDCEKFFGNHLVKMYGEFGSLDEARAAFDNLRWRNVFSWTMLVTAYTQNRHMAEAEYFAGRMPNHNVVSCNAVVVGLSEMGEVRKAREVFDEMPFPDTASWNSMASAYAQLGDVSEARCLFLHTPCKNVVSWTTLLSAYVHGGFLKEAEVLFNEMPVRNIVSWNLMLAASARAGNVQECRLLFERIPQRDSVTWNSMIPAYSNNGLVAEAEILLRIIPCSPNIMSRTSLITGYAEAGRSDASEAVFSGMQSRDTGAWNAMISAYGVVRNVSGAKLVFDRMPLWNLRSWTSMFLVHSQCADGDINETRSLFDRMPERDTVSWNALLTMYTRTSRGREALQLFREMSIEGAQPNGVTFICIVDACSQVGALAEGKLIDEEIGGSRGSVELANCFVSMYAKCGSIGDARRHFEAMKQRDSVLWTAMIIAESDSGGDTRRALGLFTEMLQEGVDPHEVTFLGVLSACAYLALLEEGWRFWLIMVGDCGVAPRGDHYTWVVNLLARSGRGGEAEELIHSMPYEPEFTTWGALLGASWIDGTGHSSSASRAAASISAMAPQCPAPYVSLANIFRHNN